MSSSGTTSSLLSSASSASCAPPARRRTWSQGFCGRRSPLLSRLTEPPRRAAHAATRGRSRFWASSSPPRPGTGSESTSRRAAWGEKACADCVGHLFLGSRHLNVNPPLCRKRGARENRQAIPGLNRAGRAGLGRGRELGAGEPVLAGGGLSSRGYSLRGAGDGNWRTGRSRDVRRLPRPPPPVAVRGLARALPPDDCRLTSSPPCWSSPLGSHVARPGGVERCPRDAHSRLCGDSRCERATLCG